MITPKEVNDLAHESTTMSIFYTQTVAKSYVTVADKVKVRRIIKKHLPLIYKKHSMHKKSWRFYKTRSYFMISNQLTTHYFKYE